MSTKLKTVLALDDYDIENSSARSVERRREHRYRTEDPAEVEIAPGPGSKIAALLMDVSRSGLRVWLNTRIETDTEIKVWLPSHTIVEGTVRYCRANDRGFDAGILIRNVICAPHYSHIYDDDLSLYLVGKGLNVMEIVRIKSHLVGCNLCRNRLAEANAALFAVRKSTSD